jgi:hypothetical protein
VATKVTMVGYRAEPDVPLVPSHVPRDSGRCAILSREQFATHALSFTSPAMLDDLVSIQRLMLRSATRPVQARLWIGAYFGRNPLGKERPDVLNPKLGFEFMLMEYGDDWDGLGRSVVVNERGCFVTTTVGWDAKIRKAKSLRDLRRFLPYCGGVR